MYTAPSNRLLNPFSFTYILQLTNMSSLILKKKTARVESSNVNTNGHVLVLYTTEIMKTYTVYYQSWSTLIPMRGEPGWRFSLLYFEYAFLLNAIKLL